MAFLRYFKVKMYCNSWHSWNQFQYKMYTTYTTYRSTAVYICLYLCFFSLSLGLFIHSIDYSAQTCVCMALFVHHAILSIGALPAAQTVHPICLDPCFSYHVYRTRTWTPPWNVEIMVWFHLSYSIYSIGSRFKYCFIFVPTRGNNPI